MGNGGTATAEALLISSVLSSGDIHLALDIGVDPSWFRDYAQEWSWIVLRHSANNKVPSITDFEHRYPNFEAEGADDVAQYAVELQERHKQALLMEGMNEAIVLMSRSSDPRALDKSMAVLGESVRKIAAVDDTMTSHSFVADARGYYQQVLATAERTKERGYAGVATGIPTIDRVTSGLQPGWLGVMAARPGCGKSALMHDMAAVQMVSGLQVLFFSAEMNRAQVNHRLTSMAEYITRQQRANSRRMNPHMLMSGLADVSKLRRFLQWMGKNITGEIEIVDKRRGSMNTAMIGAKIEEVQPDVVYVDYLQIIQPASAVNGPIGRNFETISQVSGELFGIAGRTGVPIMTASQVNRTDLSKWKPAELEQLSGSDSIGQDADLVVSWTAETPNCLLGKIIKFRHGESGAPIHLALQVAKGRVEEITAEEAEAMKVDYDQNHRSA